MKLRGPWRLLLSAALLVGGLLVGASAPVAGSTGGCAGDVVVALNVTLIVRDGFESYEFVLNEPLEPGVWSVRAWSSDASVGRSDDKQTNEQWVLDIAGHGVFGPTSDLVDGVEAANAVDHLGTVISSDGIDRITVRHVLAGTSGGANSVVAECVGFTLQESPGDGLDATSHVDCAARTIEVQLANTGSLPANYHATIGADSMTGTLAPGANLALLAGLTADFTSVSVSGDAGLVLDEVLDTTCASPPPLTFLVGLEGDSWLTARHGG